MLKRFCCALVCVLLALSLCACSTAPVIASYNGNELNSTMYALHLAFQKQAIAAMLYSEYGINIASAPEFWDEYYDEENKITWARYVQDDFCNMLVAMDYCKEHNISITDEKVIAKLDTYMQSYVETAGGEELLEIELAKYGADSDMLREYLEMYYSITLMRNHMVDNKTFSASKEEILEQLKDKRNFDIILFQSLDSSGNPLIDEEITDEQAKEFFNTDNYVTVKHVLYSTQGVTDEIKAERKETAEKNLAAINAGTAKLDDFKKDTADSGYEYTFTYGQMAEEFEKVSFELKPGEAAIAKTTYGYHLIVKEELNTEIFEKMKDDIKADMTALQVKAEAEAFFEDVKAGKTEFKKAENSEYIYQEDFVLEFSKESMGEELYGMVEKAEFGDYFFYALSDVQFFVFKSVDFDDNYIENKTEEIATNIIDDKFTLYMSGKSTSVTIVAEEMAKFDIKTARIFFEDEAETE